MQVIRTMENDAARIEVLDASGFEVFPVFVAGEYVMDGLRHA